MKVNILSNKKKLVNIVMLVGSLLICIGILLNIANIWMSFSICLLGAGLIIAFWSAFSHNIIKAKETGVKPSRFVGNISFMILSIFWIGILVWIYSTIY